MLYDEIGPAALLGLEKNKLLKAEPFVRAVHELLNQDPRHFDILMAMATEASLRGAAKVLHRHHSSVASRIDRAEAITGLDLRNPQNAFTLRLALASWRPPARD